MVFRRNNAIGTILTAFVLFLGSCQSPQPQVDYSNAEPPPAVDGEKMNGLSFVAPVREMEANAYDEALKTNANWITLMPYGYGNGNEAELHWDINWQWWGERKEGLEACVLMAHQKGFKVMVKPQIWFNHGTYTGNITFKSEKEWQTFEQSYERFILDFAEIAAKTKAESFCIGTEWREFVKARPDFWKQLIAKVRKSYKGTVTYAANWDAYEAFPHWADLDLVGIDAYFPLSHSENPTEQELYDGWAPHFKAIQNLSKKVNKPIVFTEFGFRSMDKNASEPWDSGKGTAVNLNNQVNAYNATFKRFWGEEWFKGGFIWKWFSKHSQSGGSSNNKFTPQNKPAQKTLTEWYAKYS